MFFRLGPHTYYTGVFFSVGFVKSQLGVDEHRVCGRCLVRQHMSYTFGLSGLSAANLSGLSACSLSGLSGEFIRMNVYPTNVYPNEGLPGRTFIRMNVYPADL